MTRNLALLLALSLFLGSCASRKKIVYFQNIQNIGDSSTQYEPVLKQDDLLMIVVSAPDVKAAAPFNLPVVGISGVNFGTLDSPTSQLRYQSYLVDNNGNIEFPVIGTLKLGGLTRAEAMSKLSSELKKYINDPIINMRILNFKISVIGEVSRPGTFNITTERVTLPEAISMAGDMTIYGKRDKILIIRDEEGKKTYNYVDITKTDFISSPFYYLSQNDLIYIEPNKTRVNSSVIGPNLTVGISAISLLITIISIATR